MKRIQVVIPAAGIGSRFTAIGVSTPKPVIDVLGLPMIAWVIGNFKLTSLDVVIIVTRPEMKVQDTLAHFLRNVECRVEYIYVDNLTEGPAITVSLAESALDLDDALIVANSDQYVSADLAVFENAVRNSVGIGQILTMNATSTKWSYIRKNEMGYVSEVKEKVEISNEATVGIYGWSKAKYFFDSLNSMMLSNDRTNGEFYVGPSYNYLIEKSAGISAINIGDLENHVHGLGTPEDLDTFMQNKQSFSFLNSVKENLNILESDNE